MLLPSSASASYNDAVFAHSPNRCRVTTFGRIPHAEQRNQTKIETVRQPCPTAKRYSLEISFRRSRYSASAYHLFNIVFIVILASTRKTYVRFRVAGPVSLTDTRPATAMRSCVRASRVAWPRPGDDDCCANATRCGRVHSRAGGVFVGDDVGRRHNVDDGRWRRAVLVTTDRRRVVGARVGRLVDGGRRVTTCYTNRWVFPTITVLLLLLYIILESRLTVLDWFL